VRLPQVFVGVALLLVGCAERDNPYDPVNRPLERQAVDTNWVPKPHDSVKVVLRDSATRSGQNGYTGNIQEAFTTVHSGDTLWIQGGNRYYPIYEKPLTLSNGGSERFPLVVRSFGGTAIFRLLPVDGKEGSSCLLITQPYVKLIGIAFVNCQTAIFAQGRGGPIILDSVFIEKSKIALDFKLWAGTVKLHHVQLTGTVEDPPFYLPKADSLDTLDFSWVPRSPGG
jgi:hypothetical protein